MGKWLHETWVLETPFITNIPMIAEEAAATVGCSVSAAVREFLTPAAQPGATAAAPPAAPPAAAARWRHPRNWKYFQGQPGCDHLEEKGRQ